MVLGLFSLLWKHTFITPVNKKKIGNYEASNYRPIAKLSIIPKVFEWLITGNLLSYIGVGYMRHVLR